MSGGEWDGALPCVGFGVVILVIEVGSVSVVIGDLLSCDGCRRAAQAVGKGKRSYARTMPPMAEVCPPSVQTSFETGHWHSASVGAHKRCVGVRSSRGSEGPVAGELVKAC